ncbi:MAG: DUF6090 family protein [Balneolaceae bacterium]|nr:DUF6090 family protein [Balneolaceae bacterium]
MEQNKVRTYILYALGEILLVVLGILIALQINNWNEQMKQDRSERRVIQSLILEMETNIPAIADCIGVLEESIASTDTLQAHIGPEPTGLPKKDLIRLLGMSIGTSDRCVLQTDVSDELRSSGNLNLIQSSELRRKVSLWSTTYQELKEEEEEWGNEFSTISVPYLNKWISWDDIDYHFFEASPAYNPSPFDYDPGRVLQEFEFSNILNINYWRMDRIKDRIQSLSDVTTELLQMLRDEMES